MNDDRANNNRYKLAAYCIKVSTSEIHVCKADDFFFLNIKPLYTTRTLAPVQYTLLFCRLFVCFDMETITRMK